MFEGLRTSLSKYSTVSSYFGLGLEEVGILNFNLFLRFFNYALYNRSISLKLLNKANTDI